MSELATDLTAALDPARATAAATPTRRVVHGSISLRWSPALTGVLRLADTALIQAQRLGEWCGHGPILEEDIAVSNLALDLIGQARALLTHAAALDGQGFDEDHLAFLRDERDYRHASLVELPGRRAGQDFADLHVRHLMVSLWLQGHWQAMAPDAQGQGGSTDPQLAAIAAKALKECRYHVEHSAGWVIRLGDGTAESHARTQAALERLWPWHVELFGHDAVDDEALASGRGPARRDLAADWQATMAQVAAEAGLTLPAATRFAPTGLQGVHTEHLGPLLAEMQVLQRSHPGGAW